MAVSALTEFDGYDITGGLGFASALTDVGSYAIDVQTQTRPGTTALRQSFTITPRDLTIICYGSVGSLDDTMGAVYKVFNPDRGVRTLTALRDVTDSMSGMTLQVDVLKIAPADRQMAVEVSVRAYDPVWRSIIGNTTDTVDGDVIVLPVVTIASGSAITRYHVNLTDRTGRGMSGQPLRIPLNLTASETLVYSNGRAIPFYCAGAGLWIRASIRFDRPTSIDIYYGAAISNTLTANALQLGTLDPASSSNTSWVFIGFGGEDAIQAPGVWQQQQTHAVRQGASYNYGFDSSNTVAIIGNIPSTVYSTDQTYVDPTDSTYHYYALNGSETWLQAPEQPNVANDADSYVLSSAVGILGLSGISLSEVTDSFRLNDQSVQPVFFDTNDDQINPIWTTTITPVVRYRPWTGTPWFTGVGVEGSVHLTFAVGSGIVQLAVGAEPGRGVYLGMKIEIDGTPTVTLDGDEVPIIDISAGIDAWITTGEIRCDGTGTGISVTELVFDQNAIVFDSENQTITTGSGPWFAHQIAVRNDAQWFALDPGVNVVVNTLGATWVFDEGYAV